VTSILDLLPDPSALGNWTKDGDYQLFEADDLFTYIDGGAEIYLEYGFVRIIVQEYRNDAGMRLSLEIFEMKSPAGAYGMFTFKRSPRGEPVGLGDEGQLADYYLNLYKGRYLVTITGLDPAAPVRQGLLAMASGVDRRIKESAPRPVLMDVLAEEDLLEPSLKFFRGPLGVFNSEPLLAGIAMGLESGARGDYGFGWSFFVLSYPSRGFSRKRWAEATAYFSDKQKFSDLSSSGPVLSVREAKGRFVFAQVEGNSIVFAIGSTGVAEARSRLDRVAAKLRSLPQRR
jgi:Family of unknown function (DUF6599)